MVCAFRQAGIDVYHIHTFNTRIPVFCHNDPSGHIHNTVAERLGGVVIEYHGYTIFRGRYSCCDDIEHVFAERCRYWSKAGELAIIIILAQVVILSSLAWIIIPQLIFLDVIPGTTTL